ncbi:hypothetical protein BDP27DRAFT_940938 [Rhodocollybia butyracea]|uniref:Uncharacterized protein n=1 Tax=Rhodocollybia butyracea TaxID=206335 RepID=A0A9P5U5T0_9AGAR|nr:hypothetical protein BDP27DRAFT_940938 [Rhodocollybia butyracea]
MSTRKNTLPPLASANEVIIQRTLNLAFHNAAAASWNLESVHWQIISIFLELDALRSSKISKTMLDFIINWSSRLIEQTTICDFDLQPSELVLHYRYHLLEQYLAAAHGNGSTIMITMGETTMIDPGEKPQSLRPKTYYRAIEGTIREITLGQKSSAECLHPLVCDYIAHALQTDPIRLNAHQLAVDYDCMMQIAQYSYIASYSHTRDLFKVAAFYITALNDIGFVGSLAREQYIDYLLQPLTMQMVVLSLISLQFYDLTLQSYPPFEHLVDYLIKLRPDAHIWDDCQNWLMLLSNWMENNKNLDKEEMKQRFNDQGLVEPLVETFFLEIVVPLWLNPGWGIDVESNIKQMISMLGELSSGKEVALSHPTIKAQSPLGIEIQGVDNSGANEQRESLRRPLMNRILRWRTQVNNLGSAAAPPVIPGALSEESV